MPIFLINTILLEHHSSHYNNFQLQMTVHILLLYLFVVYKFKAILSVYFNKQKSAKRQIYIIINNTLFHSIFKAKIYEAFFFFHSIVIHYKKSHLSKHNECIHCWPKCENYTLLYVCNANGAYNSYTHSSFIIIINYQ
jgi:hypothetical protein